MATPDGSHASSAVVASGDNRIDSLLMAEKWGGAVGTGSALTFSFPGASSAWWSMYSGEPSDTSGDFTVMA